jgi:hypothetical protein
MLAPAGFKPVSIPRRIVSFETGKRGLKKRPPDEPGRSKGGRRRKGPVLMSGGEVMIVDLHFPAIARLLQVKRPARQRTVSTAATKT